MPELPEVESARRLLARFAAGRRVQDVRAAPGRPLRDSPGALRRALLGTTLGRAQRHGKQLLLPVREPSGARRGLALHLGMTGRLAPVPAAADEPRFTRLALLLDDGVQLAFLDPRRFGRVELTDSARVAELPVVRELGPDPLRPPLTGARLRDALAGTRRAVKVALMDQRRLAGVGNIQATEALWRARVDPHRPADQLQRGEPARIASHLVAVLEETLAALQRELDMRTRRLRAGDARAFLEPLYVSEGSENRFDVYGRAGAPCPRCRTRIERTVLDGRGTTWCPRCQRQDEGSREKVSGTTSVPTFSP